MGEMVTFPSNGGQAEGYLAVPDSGSGPGVVVVQEWWGLNQQIKEVCDRYAAEGFVALAPDLYRGTEVSLQEPDEAAKMMMALNIEQAAKDMVGAIDYLQGHDAVTSDGVGATGYCIGGGVALWLAALRTAVVQAAGADYRIIPLPAAQPRYFKIAAAGEGPQAP